MRAKYPDILSFEHPAALDEIIEELMSAFGTKRTWRSHSSMSAFGGKADIGLRSRRAFPPPRQRGFAGKLFDQSFPQILAAVLPAFLPNFLHVPVGQQDLHAASAHEGGGFAANPYRSRRQSGPMRGRHRFSLKTC